MESAITWPQVRTFDAPWALPEVSAAQVALDAVAERDARIPAFLRLAPSFLVRYPPGSDVHSAAEASGLLTNEELEISAHTSDATAVRTVFLRGFSGCFPVSLISPCTDSGTHQTKRTDRSSNRYCVCEAGCSRSPAAIVSNRSLPRRGFGTSKTAR